MKELFKYQVFQSIQEHEFNLTTAQENGTHSTISNCHLWREAISTLDNQI